MFRWLKHVQVHHAHVEGLTQVHHAHVEGFCRCIMHTLQKCACSNAHIEGVYEADNPSNGAEFLRVEGMQMRPICAFVAAVEGAQGSLSDIQIDTTCAKCSLSSSAMHVL